MISGTNYSRMNSILSNKTYYLDFCNNKIDEDHYLNELIGEKEEFIENGFTLDDLYLTSRTPRDEIAFVNKSLQSLVENNIISHGKYQIESFIELRKKIYSSYNHENYQTYIFPEEEHLAFAISNILNPKSICVLGSYYGYWASWLSSIYDRESHITLIDPDAKVLELAKKNFSSLSIENADFICEDGVTFLKKNNRKYDFVMLDAETPKNHPIVDYRGKSIYGPLTEAVTNRTNKNAVLIAHNIIVSKINNNPYFINKSSENMKALSKFINIMNKDWGGITEIGSTEGIGVAQRKL
jgi:predicted O-methyltransferase YrrM